MGGSSPAVCAPSRVTLFSGRTLWNLENQDGKDSVWITDRFKLLTNKKGTRLYDIKADSAEKKNLAKKYPKVMSQMMEELATWKKDVLKDLQSVPK